MIFIIGKKVRSKNLLLKISKTKYNYEFIEYFSKNKYLIKNKKYSENRKCLLCCKRIKRYF